MIIVAPILLGLSCLGLGAVVLRVTGRLDDLRPAEAWTWAFALGFGMLGWISFLVGATGQFTVPVLAAVCVASIGGIVLLHRRLPNLPHLSVAATALAGLMVFVALGDLAEALSPPADADSLAYHFFIPKLFLKAQQIFFIPRASDGAAPLLPQMTYLVALGLGGEEALTLWVALTGWAAAGLVYTLLRRYLSVAWSLGAALLFATLPAVLYGAGTGQVETRITLFTLVSAFALADGRRGDRGAIVIAALGAGFYAASKYPGLIFVLVGAVLLLAMRRRVADVFIFGLVATAAGCQWYLWNAWHTGDPFFPLLYGILPYRADVDWNAAQHAFMRADFFGSEKSIPTSLVWLVLYPLKATFFPDSAFEAGRVGLGAVYVLLLPFAVAGAWRLRSRLLVHPLAVVAVLALLVYVLWFFLGPSQRVRHLLPIAPLILVPLMTAAVRSVEAWPDLRVPVIAGLAMTLAVQAAGQAVVTAKYVRHLVSGETREAFLDRNIVAWPMVEWVNANLGPHDRLFVNLRQLNYLFDVPIFYGHPQVQAEVEVRPDSTDVRLFWSQLRRAGITHGVSLAATRPQAGADTLFTGLIAAGCAEIVRDFDVRGYASRTLPQDSGRVHTRLIIYRLRVEACALS